MASLLREDLDHILLHTEKIWGEFRNQKIFITGGTGFFGCWLLESFAWANDKLGLNASALILSRNPKGFQEKAPHLAAHPAIHFHAGDVRDFDFPDGHFSHVIHASNEAINYVNEENCRRMTEGMTQAAKHVLDFTRFCGARTVLFTSSGSIYGPQPAEMIRIPENYLGARNKDDFRFAHGEGKYRAELLFCEYTKQYGMEAKIARCFSFLGPYLPLSENYAIGNFIRDGIQGRVIRVTGDGTPVRSYMYASDLVIWLLTILVQGKSCEPYNVGSENSLDIKALAMTVAQCFENVRDVDVAIEPVPGKSTERYVPSTAKARADLGLRQYVTLSEGIRKTLLWFLQLGQIKRERSI
jgi:nucleoside-diphosphate-sugar epimerase